MSDDSAYRLRVSRILDAASSEVAGRLARFAEAATEGLVIDVSVGQDAEGPFDVWVRFDGPDAFSLDRRFDDERRIFGVEWGEEGWEPDVPGRPGSWSPDDLEEHLLEIVSDWLVPLLPESPETLRWEIGVADGVIEPRVLTPGDTGART